MTSDCTNEEIGGLITFYELNRLEEKDRRRFERHLLECNFCCRQLKEMQPLAFAMQQRKAEILKKLAEEGISFTEESQALLEAYLKRPSTPIVQALSEKLRRWLEDLRRPVIWVPVAAIAALLLVFLLPRSRSPNPYLPYLDYSKAPYTRVAFRGPAGQIKVEAREAFESGMVEYLRDNYKLAIRNLERAVQLTPEESQYWYYLGVSHYLDHHPEKAIGALTRALSARDEEMLTSAQWYLAQAYLLKGDAEQALPLLGKIARQGGNYAPRADSLLIRIGSTR